MSEGMNMTCKNNRRE